MENILRFREFSQGEVFVNAYDAAVKKVFIQADDRKSPDLVLEVLRDIKETPQCMEEFLYDFALKEYIGDSIERLKESFRIENILLGYTYLQSLSEIHDEIKKRLLSQYKRYEEEHLRSIKTSTYNLT